MNSFSKIPAKFQIEDFVQLRPPGAQIVAIKFVKTKDGNVAPFYDVVSDQGGMFTDIPESEILGLDAVALSEYNARQMATTPLADATTNVINGGFAGAGAGENTPYADVAKANPDAGNENGERTFGDLPGALKN